MDRDPCSRLGACSRDAEAIKEHPFFNGLDWTKVLNKEYPVPKPEMRKLDSKINLTKSIFIDLKHNKEGINVIALGSTPKKVILDSNKEER